MRSLDTNRLLLLPLTPEQLNLWLNDLPSLERELACKYDAEPVQGIFREIVASQLAETLRDREHYVWHTFWFLLRKADGVVVGSADFKDVPDASGEVEIGYGLGREYEHMGLMSEAVEAMCSWALSQSGVAHIIAETELDGYASQRVLLRCGFKQYSCIGSLWFRR